MVCNPTDKSVSKIDTNRDDFRRGLFVSGQFRKFEKASFYVIRVSSDVMFRRLRARTEF